MTASPIVIPGEIVGRLINVPPAVAARDPLPDISIMLFGKDEVLIALGHKFGRSSLLFMQAEVTVQGRAIAVFTRRAFPNVAMVGEGWTLQLAWVHEDHAYPVDFEGDEDLCVRDLDALRDTLSRAC